MARFFMDTSLLGTNSVQSTNFEYCDKCQKGFITEIELEETLVFCSNAFCDVNYVKSNFLNLRKREVNKK